MTTAMITPAAPPQHPPHQSIEQRMSALARANEIRARRARLKRELKAGRASVPSIVLEPPSYVETMKLWDLMIAMPRWGRVKVNRTLTHLRISPSKTIGGLSERQRHEIVVHIGQWQAARES